MEGAAAEGRYGRSLQKTLKRPPPLNAETVARMFDCQDEFGDTRTRVAVAVLLVVLSVILVSIRLIHE